MKASLSIAAVLLVSGSYVTAEPAALVSGVMSLGVNAGRSDTFLDNRDTQGFDVSADLDIEFSDDVSIGFVFSHRENTIKDVLFVSETPSDLNTSVSRWGIEPKYTYDSHAFSGAYYQNFTLDVEGTSFGLNSVGVFGGYVDDSYKVQLYAGHTKSDRLMVDSMEMDATNVGASGSFTASDALNIFGHVSFADVSNWYGEDESNTLLSAGFDYNASDTISIYGAVASYDLMGSENPITQVALGIGADLASMGVNLPGMVTADWTHTDYDIFDFKSNQFSLGWTYNFGGSDVRPQNCVVDNARGLNRAPVAAAFECVGLAIAAPS